tara:strand:+ start:651 stop:1337 length:687 start_codon:yes stop_codon:yes gene_type:complete
MIKELNDRLDKTGLFVRGGFYPSEADDVPRLPNGKKAETVILIGNAGVELWRSFQEQAVLSRKQPLDSWLRSVIEGLSECVGAHMLLPNEGPPFIPIQKWAMRAEPVYRSPIGILIHPEYGLWHVYRAALIFSTRLALPIRSHNTSPCATCRTRPCLSVCPADAFLPDRFDASSCVSHVESNAGKNCLDKGCLARRACPVGKEYRYEVAQQAFHTHAMVRAVKSGFGG